MLRTLSYCLDTGSGREQVMSSVLAQFPSAVSSRVEGFSGPDSKQVLTLSRATQARPVVQSSRCLLHCMAPPVSAEYATFGGHVVECEVSDKATQHIFEDAMSLSRFQAAFSVENHPLMVGLDFEWKPDKRGAETNRIALIQVACWDTCVLLRTVNCSELPAWFQSFLETGDEVIKVVASFDQADKEKLLRSFGWDFKSKAVKSSFWDIADLADAHSVPRGLFKMAQYFHVPIQKLKMVGTSNWENDKLSQEQRAYAADDAFFQLYLFGKLLDVSAPEVEKKILKAWQLISEKIEGSINMVDNSAYQANFLALREVVRNAVDVLSNALGSGGSTNLNEILNYQPVKTAVAAQKHSPVQINAHFLRQNADAFVVFFRDGQLRVKTRLAEEDAEVRNGSDADLSEDVEALIFEVQELLAAYKAPNGKKPRLPEPPWVPARAVLSRPQCARLEACLSSRFEKRSRAHFESCYDSEDGLLLRLLHHPRAPDDAEYMERSVQGLVLAVEIDADEARRRLGSDDKFMHFWKLLRAVEMNSPEEMAIAGSLRARARIHADAHRLATRISVDVAWLQVFLGQPPQEDAIS